MHKNRLGAFFAFGLVLSIGAPGLRAQNIGSFGQDSILLSNGDVRTAGGATNNTSFAAATNGAELFLSSGSFATTSPMNTQRFEASGTFLPDGTVLVAGGINTGSGAALNTAEIYNPVTGAWTATSGNMGSARFAHTATLLQNGTVLLCGGFSNSSYSANSTCDIYNPSSGQFTSGPSFNEARGYHTATLLTDGRIFVTGGFNPAATPPYLLTSEIYTPGPGNTFQAAHALNVERSSHTATLMGNGEVLIAGGYNEINENGSNGYISDTEIYDPVSDSMQTSAPMEEFKAFQTATLMPNGSVQVFGGFGNIPYTYMAAQSITVNGSLTASDSPSQYGFSGTTSFDSTTGGSISVPLSIQLGVQASGMIQNGVVIFSSPSITTADGHVHAYFVSGSSNPLQGLRVNLAGTPVTCSNGTCGIISGNFNLSGLSGGSYQIQNLAESAQNMSVSGTIDFTTCDAATSPCSLTGGSLSGTMTVALPGEFVGYTIDAGSVTVTNATLTTSTSTLQLNFALGAIPANTSVTSDGKGGGLATFSTTLNNLTGQVTLQSGSTATVAAMGGPLFPTTNMGSITTNVSAVIDGVNLTAASFNLGVSTVVINEMFFGDNECYNPSKDQWAFCVRQNSTVFTGRFGHSATLLPNGDLVLLGGLTCLGASDCPNPNTAPPNGWSTISGLSIDEYFNSSFLAGAGMSNARGNFTGTLLPSGKILIAGGAQGNAVLNQSEIYNPASNSFSAAPPMINARDFHTATLMVNGNVLVAGGFTANSSSTGTTSAAEVYYSSTSLWAQTSPMSTPRENATATLLPNGAVLVAGGYNSNTNQYLDTAEIYYSTSASWALTGDMSAPYGGNGGARAFHTATLLQNGSVLVVGGVNFSGVLSGAESAEIYNPITGAWSAAGSIPQSIYQHTATLLPDGNVLIAGGDSGSGETSAAYIYNPNSNTWAQTGSLNVARFNHTATLLPDGRVLVAGGAQASNTILNSVEIFNEESQNWINLTTLTTPRAYHATILTTDGNLHVIGGFNGSNDLTSTEEMYFTSPPDQESGTSSSLRLSSITAVIPTLFDRGASITLLGKNFEGNTEASGGGAGPLNSSFYAPRLILNSLGSSGGGSSQGDSGFAIDLTTNIYSVYGGINSSWQNLNSSITVSVPGSFNSLPYGWYGARTISNAQYANAAIVRAGPATPAIAPTSAVGTVVSSSTVNWTWSWSGNPSSISGFDVYSATCGLFLSTIPANVNSFVESNLPPSSTAQITVAAYTLSGDGPGAASSVNYSLPAAPFNLALSSVTNVSVNLTWNANQNSGGTIYEVSDSTDDFVTSFSTPVPTSINLTTNTVEISPLNPNTTYFFRVRAATIGGVFSSFSNIVSTETTISVLSVSGAPCASNGTSCIQWTWASPGGTVNYYNVYNATAPGILIATPTATSFADSGLAVNSARSIEVSAVTPQGPGPLSAPATTYTLAATPSPTSPSIVILDSGSFIGAWQPNGNPNGTPYQMQVLVNGSVIATVSTSSLSALFNGISPAATAFSAQVAAINQVGTASAYLSLGSSATYAAAPSSLTVTGVGPTSISLSWLTSQNSSSATYQVSYSTDNFATTNLTALPFSSHYNGSTYTLTGLSSTLIYYLRVQAQNTAGQTTAFSNTVSTEPFNAGASSGTLGGVIVPNQASLLQGLMPDGMTITLNAPPGVVNSPVTLFISTIGFGSSPCPGSVNTTGFTIQANPAVEPLVPYYLSVSYSPNAIPFTISQASLVRIDASGNCVPLASAVDTVHDIINATVNHFSEFVVAQQTPGGAANDTKIFPNPFYPSRGNGYVTFSNAPAGARIRIFTLHGELVFDGNTDASGVLIWPGTNRAGRAVASGVYLVTVEGGGTQHIFKAVVLR